MTWEAYNNEYMPRILGMQEGDIYIQEPRYGDPLINDPEKWLNQKLSQLTERQ